MNRQGNSKARYLTCFCSASFIVFFLVICRKLSTDCSHGASIRWGYESANEYILQFYFRSPVMSGEGQYLISNDGTKIWADACGDPSKPSVVFIHGLSCTALAFERQFSDPELLKNLYMIRYEMRGHGRSGHPEDFNSYASIRFAEDFKTVCDAYRLKKPFICGWSMGGLVPVDVVDAYGAEKISGVLLPGGPMITRTLHHQYIHPFMKENLPLFLKDSADIQAKAAVLFVESCVENPSVSLPFETKIKWIGGYLMQSPSIRTHIVTRTQDSERWEREIKDIPVQIIQGELDRHSMTEKLIPVAKKYLPKLELHIIEGVGHAPCFERPEQTNRLMLEFVQRFSLSSQLSPYVQRSLL